MIRAAEPQDSVLASALIVEAIGSIATDLTGAESQDAATSIIAAFFSQRDNRLSFENALIAEFEEQVVGVLIAYHGSQADALDRPISDRLISVTRDASATIQREAEPNEFYLDTLCVRADYRGRGIAQKLIAEFEALAKERDYRTLGLLVDEDNVGAARLYARLGYVASGEITLSGHQYTHLVKHLP